MDSFVPSGSARRHSKWRRGGAFLKVYLIPFRKLIQRRRTGKLANARPAEEVERDGNTTLPGIPATLLAKEMSIQQPPIVMRANLRKRPQRHDSQQSPLASIQETETETVDEEIEPLSLSQTSPPRATLLGIPPELRNQIYKYIFCDWQSAKPLAFLQTCRHIHAEAANFAFSKTLFRLNTEHWADHDFFQARYSSQLSRARLSSLGHLALRLPRGAPYDCYASCRLHVDLPALGFNLRTLVIFSQYPRPLPRISDYGGVTEMELCHWLSETLYNMPSITELRILNYESPCPGLFDIPSPRLVRLLRGQIYRDVMTERQSLSEEEFQWHCHCEQERSYGVYSAKLGRTVNIMFETGESLDDYGLGYVDEMRLHLGPDEILRAAPADLSGAVSGAKSNSGRRRLSKTLSLRHSMRQSIMTRSSSSDQINVAREVPPTYRASAPTADADAAPKRKRLSKRYSLQSPLQSNGRQLPQETLEEQQQRRMRHRQSWHASGSTMAVTAE
jgi:hypothetical protein